MSAYQHGFTGDAVLGTEDAVRFSASALPSAHPSYTRTGIPRQPLSDSPLYPVPKSGSALDGRQLYSTEQWEAQKPVIYRLYNQENKPYNQVLEILRTQHSFFPTYTPPLLLLRNDKNLFAYGCADRRFRRRQFYRKINEWGFQKNIKESEMRAIAKTLENDKTVGIAELKGRQIDLAKIQRWQKRQARMKGLVPMPSFANQLIDVPMGNYIDPPNGREPSLPTTGKSTLILVDSASTSTMEVRVSSQSVNIWDTVDVPGSPTLSRLFKALQIECPTEIPPISIGSPIATSAESYIADIERGGIRNGEQSDNAPEKGPSGARSISNCSSVVLRREYPPLSCPEWNLPNESFDEWAFSQWDFSKGHPFSIEMNTGPMRPISPFPISPSTIALTPIVPCGQSKELEMQETCYKSRLSRFKRLFGADDLRTVGAMCSLATIYYRQSKFQQEECLLRHIAKSTQRTHGFKHRETLHAYLRVVRVLCTQGKFRQAIKIHQLVHATIQTLIDPEDKLSILSTNYLSDICYGFCQYEEADKLDRQILQIRLNALGPRHIDTLEGIWRVATSLRQRGHLLECEQLLSIIHQFQTEIQGIDDELVCRIEGELAEALRQQGRYRESIDLASKARGRSKISLGLEHPATTDCLITVADCLVLLGQHMESENLLRKVLELQLERRGEFYRGTVDTMDHLAATLGEMGRHQEAVTYREKCFRADAENYGLEHIITIRSCEELGLCYENLGRYEDAFGLYHRTVDQLRDENCDDHSAIAKIQGWIAGLRNYLDRQEFGGQEDHEFSDENLCSESNSVEEEEEGGNSNSAKIGEAVAGEDWMNDFVDFQNAKVRHRSKA